MYKKTMSAKVKKNIYLHVCTHTDKAYIANILRERMTNMLWLSIDVIHASYTDNRKKEMRKDAYNLSPNFKIQLDFALEGKRNPLALPPLPTDHTHTHTHTQEDTSFEFKALRESVE